MSTQRPRVSVATIVVDQDRLLFVEEDSPDGPVLNQPAGHLEAGETLQQAAIRETLEETAWTIRLTALVGIYQWRTPGGTDFVRVGFAGVPVEHHPARSLDRGIRRALWLTPAQLRAERHRLRSPLVEAQLQDWLSGSRHPLSIMTLKQ